MADATSGRNGPGNAGGSGNAGNGQSGTPSGSSTSPATTGQPGRKKEIEWGPVRKEAYAICRKGDKTHNWWCDGPRQDLIISDELTVEAAMSLAGCKNPTQAAGGRTKGGQAG
jgi:hypothetical protein